MNSFTRVALPIFLVVALVFGLTFISRNTPDSPGTETNSSGTGLPSTAIVARDAPLVFYTVHALVPPVNKPVAERERHLLNWNPEIEVDQLGHYEFWCSNKHSSPVSVRVTHTSCQCIGTEFAIVPQSAWVKYLQTSALSGGPFGSIGTSLLAHLELDRALTWSLLYRKGDLGSVELPPADPVYGPQMGMVRMNWTGKPPTETKRLSAQLFANIPDAPPSHFGLDASIAVVPSFVAYRKEPNAWLPAPEIQFGELRENMVLKQTIYLTSATRNQLILNVEMDGGADPCIVWSDAVMASPEEMTSLRDYLAKEEKTRLSIKSLYKLEVTIRERATVEIDGKQVVKQLDLGLLDRRAKLVAISGGTQPIALRAQILGDIVVSNGTSGSDSGRVELGSSFPADQDRSKTVIIKAERPGLDVTLVEDETIPPYLKVKLEPQPPIDGLKRWRLSVTVPKNKLLGTLPERSCVILKTNDPTPRRVRIPIRGASADSGERPF